MLLLAHPVLAVRRQPGQMAVVIIPRIAVRIVLDVKVPGDGGRVRAEALAGARIAGLYDKDGVAGLGKVRGYDAASRSAANDDVIILGVGELGHWCRGDRGGGERESNEKESGKAGGENPSAATWF